MSKQQKVAKVWRQRRGVHVKLADGSPALLRRRRKRFSMQVKVKVKVKVKTKSEVSISTSCYLQSQKDASREPISVDVMGSY